MTGLRCLTALATSALLSSAAHAAVVYNEAASGDLSNSGASPTFVAMASSATNTVLGSTGNPGTGTDRDYFRFTVPAGQMLTAITVAPGTVALGAVSFIGLQAGAQVTAPVNGPATVLLGWTHYAGSDIGNNILPTMGLGAGAIGFVGALGAGSYAIWIQDFGAGTAPYGFDFTLAPVPEAPAALMLAAGLAALYGLRRRRVT